MRVGKRIWNHKANLDPKDANQSVLTPLWRGSFRSMLKHSTLWSWSIKLKLFKLNFLPVPCFFSQKLFLSVIFSLYFIWPQFFTACSCVNSLWIWICLSSWKPQHSSREIHKYICNRVRNVNPIMKSCMYSTCAYVDARIFWKET